MPTSALRDPEAALRRTRRMASAVLAALALVFFATYLDGSPPGWLLLIRSMAEAGMVGGLADWFAVTALFRHPLGIPIPHTALLPRNQKRAAANVGRFFDQHFLQPEQLRARLMSARPSVFLLGWISDPAHARLIADKLAPLLVRLLEEDPPPRLMVRGRSWVRRAAEGFGSDETMADRMADLIKTGIRTGVLDHALAVVERSVRNRRDSATQLVEDHSKWWVAAKVDRGVAKLVVGGILAVLAELRDRDSRLRGRFERACDEMVDDMAERGALKQAVAEARHYMIRSGALDEAFTQMLPQMRSSLIDSLNKDPERTADALAGVIRNVATGMLSSEAVRADFDRNLADLATRIISELRPQLASYVTDVIAGWEPEDLNTRFEAELGPDLQYIRINGAVLGALIGGALFFLEHLLG
ncbi:DUF445 domain-containing protein [Paracoccus sediminicola]|uniref:DUF445 domain-containing protein n=1 Tax=Paracoccus sediminicola TaxID=3017783 RepID=UPI0022F06D94|nr:DUF445 domain-containing protein [Paracoccus sediminicola]WBU55722.1 DUF445 domain-containing protein [Paracoccus sediminicola]